MPVSRCFLTAAVAALAMTSSALAQAADTGQAVTSRNRPSLPVMADDGSALARIRALEGRIRVLEDARHRLDDSLAKAATTEPKIRAGDQGFLLRSADGDFQLRMRGYFQSDGRFFMGDHDRPATGTFLLRRVRPLWDVTLWKYLGLRLMPDFGGGQATIYDAYVDLRISPALNVRSGKFKPPIGLERLQSATNLAFVERADPTNLAPNRDVGIQLSGDLAGGIVSYAAGVFNGVADLGFGDGDTGDDKDVAGRVFLLPFARSKGTALAGLGVGIAGSRGIHRGSVGSPSLQAYRSPAQQSVFAFRADGAAEGTTIADGAHERLAPQGYYYRGPVGAMWEYIQSSQVVRRGNESARLRHHAWQTTASLLLTGETASYEGIVPRHPFDPARRTWGALELAARYSRLVIDPDAFPVFADPARQIQRQRTIGVGLNWYLRGGVRVLLDYEDTRFAGGAAAGDRSPERSVLTRIQHSF